MTFGSICRGLHENMFRDSRGSVIVATRAATRGPSLRRTSRIPGFSMHAALRFPFGGSSSVDSLLRASRGFIPYKRPCAVDIISFNQISGSICTGSVSTTQA